MSESTDVAVQRLSDFDLTSWGGVEGSNVFDEISVDAKFEIETGAEAFDCCSGLDSDAKRGFEGGATRGDDYGKRRDYASGAI